MKKQTLPITLQKDASVIKTYLEYLVRNLSKLGVQGKGLEILRGRIFAVNIMRFPGKNAPSAFISFNISDSDTRRFVHHPGSDALVPINVREAMAGSPSFIVLASTDRKTPALAAKAYVGRVHPILRQSLSCKEGKNIIIEDGFAGKKGGSAPKSIQLFTVTIDVLSSI